MSANNKNNRQNPAPRAGGSNNQLGPAPAQPQKNHRNRRLCRTSEYKPPGSSVVGLTRDNQPSKVVWELDYSLNSKQREALGERFPGIAFVQTGIGCHDHPIAHTSYRVVWENVMKLLPAGSLVADISGNPAHNDAFNKSQAKRDNPIRVDTFCKVVSPKDSIRAKTRWGPKVKDGTTRWEELTMYDMYRNEQARERFAKYDRFLMNHCLYYYTKAEVCKLLSMNPEAVLYATLHKLPGEAGTINCGEQRYRKDLVTGETTQTNVETGEEYRHPDPMIWFRDFMYADRDGAIAWTINKGCDDTYVVTITSTQSNLVPEEFWSGGKIVFERDGEVAEVDIPVVEALPAYEHERVVYKTSDLIPGAQDKTVQIEITHPKLYTSLKHFMLNKPRTAQTLRDLTAKAHREVGNNHLLGGVAKVDITPEALSSHVFAAWMAGVDYEASMFSVVQGSAAAYTVNSNLAGRGLNINRGNWPNQVLRYAIAATTVYKSKEPAQAVLRQVEELL